MIRIATQNIRYLDYCYGSEEPLKVLWCLSSPIVLLIFVTPAGQSILSSYRINYIIRPVSFKIRNAAPSAANYYMIHCSGWSFLNNQSGSELGISWLVSWFDLYIYRITSHATYNSKLNTRISIPLPHDKNNHNGLDPMLISYRLAFQSNIGLIFGHQVSNSNLDA
jgi:hypothetical protein